MSIPAVVWGLALVCVDGLWPRSECMCGGVVTQNDRVDMVCFYGRDHHFGWFCSLGGNVCQRIMRLSPQLCLGHLIACSNLKVHGFNGEQSPRLPSNQILPHIPTMLCNVRKHVQNPHSKHA